MIAHRADGSLDEATRGLGRYAELLAHLAIAALASVVQAEALFDGAVRDERTRAYLEGRFG